VPPYLPTIKIAEKYGAWYNSKPFDIGTTTKRGVQQLKKKAIPARAK